MDETDFNRQAFGRLGKLTLLLAASCLSFLFLIRLEFQVSRQYGWHVEAQSILLYVFLSILFPAIIFSALGILRWLWRLGEARRERHRLSAEQMNEQFKDVIGGVFSNWW